MRGSAKFDPIRFLQVIIVLFVVLYSGVTKIALGSSGPNHRENPTYDTSYLSSNLSEFSPSRPFEKPFGPAQIMSIF